MKWLYLIGLFVQMKNVYGIFQMVSPSWGQEIKEHISVQIPSKEVSKNSFVGFKMNKGKLFTVAPILKNNCLEYLLDIKKLGILPGKVTLEAVLYKTIGKKTYEKTSHKVLLNINSEWQPKNHTLQYKFPLGSQWVYRYRSYIRPEGPEINTLEPDIKGKVAFSFMSKVKENVWVEARLFPDNLKDKTIKIRDRKDSSKTVVLSLDKVLSFWAQYNTKGISSLERVSPLESLDQESIETPKENDMEFFVVYLPVLCDQPLQKNLKTEISVSDIKIINNEWKINQKNMEWSVVSLDWLKGHRAVRFQYKDQNDKGEVCWDLQAGRPISWSITKKIEISESLPKKDDKNEKNEETKPSLKTYISTEVFELDQ